MASLTRHVWELICHAATLIGNIVSVLASASEPSKRAQLEGTDLIGDYNYRTTTMDAGTDPCGWYEEDM